jgi:Flp pilus assembly pilin Flp
MGYFRRLRSLQRDQRGLSTVEYTVLLVLILAGAITLWKKLGQDVHDKLGKAQGEFSTKVAPASGGGGGGGGGIIE